MDGDALATSPAQELTKIEQFLKTAHFFNDKVFVFNSKKGFYCLREPAFGRKSTKDNMKCLDSGKGHQHPNVSSSVVRKMKRYLRPHNERFYKLAGKQFDWD